MILHTLYCILCTLARCYVLLRCKVVDRYLKLMDVLLRLGMVRHDTQ